MAQRFFEFRSLPTWITVTLVALLTVFAADDLRLFLVDAEAILQDREQLMVYVAIALGSLVAYLAVLRTPWATVVSIPMLVMHLFTGDFIGGLIGGVFIVFFAPVTCSWLCTVTTWVLYGVWTVVGSALRGPDWGDSFWVLSGVFVATALLGTAVRRFQEHLSHSRRELAELARENASIREDERAALARELHDVVAHELSLISLQITSRSHSEDPAELHRVLESVRRSTQSALYELRLLVGVLRDDGPDDGSDLGYLNEDTSVTRVLAALESRMGELGYRVRLAAPPEVDELPSTIARTMIRVLQESSTNIIKHAPPGSECRAEVRVDPRHVALTVRNPLGVGADDPALHRGPTGWGLRGLAERVDLLGGELEAGPRGDEWIVSARIPLAADERA